MQRTNNTKYLINCFELCFPAETKNQCFRCFFLFNQKNSPIISIDWNMNLKGHTQTGRSNQWQTKRKKNSLLFFSNIFIVLFSHRCSLFGLDACRVFLLLRLMFVKHLTQATVACFSLLFSFHLSIVIVLRSLPWHFDDQQQLYCYHFLGPRWSENGNSGENGCLYIGMFYHFHRLFYFTFFFACCCLFA